MRDLIFWLALAIVSLAFALCVGPFVVGCGGQVFEVGAGELLDAQGGELDAGAGADAEQLPDVGSRGDGRHEASAAGDVGAPLDDAGGAVDVGGDGCGVAHSDGFGHGFEDCIAAGTVDAQLAGDACRALCGQHAGWTCSCGIGCAGTPAGSPGGVYLIDPAGSYYEWWFVGPLAGRVGVKAQSCPTSAAGSFQ